MKRAMKKTELIGFFVTAEQKHQARKLAEHFRKGLSAFVRDLVLTEIGKWSTVVATEEPEKKPWQGRADVALGR